MSPFTRLAYSSIIREAMLTIEAHASICKSDYRQVADYEEYLRDFIAQNGAVPSIDAVACKGLNLLRVIKEALDCHFLDFKDKLATFKTCCTPILSADIGNLAEELVRIVAKRDRDLRSLVMHLNADLSVIVEPELLRPLKEEEKSDTETQIAEVYKVLTEAATRMSVLRTSKEYQTFSLQEAFSRLVWYWGDEGNDVRSILLWQKHLFV